MPGIKRTPPSMHVVEVHILEDHGYSWQEIEEMVQNKMSGTLGAGITVSLIQHMASDDISEEKGNDDAEMIILDEDMTGYRLVDTVVRARGALTQTEKNLILSKLELADRVEILSHMTHLDPDFAENLIRVYVEAHSERQG